MARELGIFEIMYNCRATRRLKQDPVERRRICFAGSVGRNSPDGEFLEGSW